MAVLAETVHNQATRAQGATAEQRPAAYAELTKACAGCHAILASGRD